MGLLWPAALPQNLIVGFSSGVADNRLPYQPDQGPAIVRRRTTSTPRALSGTMKMTRAQLATFRQFFDVALNGGVAPFTFTDPSDGSAALVRFVTNKAPGWQQIGGGVFRLSIDLEILP